MVGIAVACPQQASLSKVCSAEVVHVSRNDAFSTHICSYNMSKAFHSWASSRAALLRPSCQTI